MWKVRVYVVLLMHNNIPRRGPSVSASNSHPSLAIDQRRSQRILISVPLIVSGSLGNGSVFRENTTTVVVGAHGAQILLSATVYNGQTLTIRNIATGEEISCVVRDIGRSENGHSAVGLEFTESRPRFWRVAFPPPDWSHRSPEAKRFVLPEAPLVKPTE